MRSTRLVRVAVALVLGSLLATALPGVASAARPQGILLLPAIGVDAGDAHACATVEEGVPFCWGDDTYWQLGNYDRVGSLTPLPVDVDSQRTYLQDVLSVAAGESSSCAVKADGSAVCWGASMLGDGTNDPSVLPVEVVQDDLSPLGGVTQVSVGGDVACARTSDGGAWCWGAGSVTGDGTFTERLGAVRVRTPDGTPLADVVSVSAGADSACAVTSKGAAWCWGRNTTSQIGDGTTRERRAAVRVKDARGRIKGVETISVGSGFGCLSRRDGSAWCWGDGFWGNLGDGRSESSKVAVRVIARGGLPRVRQVSAGESHACAATVSGSAFCWGSNLSGELGTGTHKKSPIAVQVRRGAKALGKVTSVSAGNTFSCAWQGAPQAVWCWGANESGEVGDGTGDDQYVAVKVLFSFP